LSAWSKAKIKSSGIESTQGSTPACIDLRDFTLRGAVRVYAPALAKCLVVLLAKRSRVLGREFGEERLYPVGHRVANESEFVLCLRFNEAMPRAIALDIGDQQPSRIAIFAQDRRSVFLDRREPFACPPKRALSASELKNWAAMMV
jgi:hypothetical protein